jgi:hypothetical protein
VHATPGLYAVLKRTAVLLCGVLLVATALAADDRFAIRNAFAEPIDGIWNLNVIVETGLSRSARDALTEGIPLTMLLDVQISGERRFLPDSTIAELQQRWELAFDALSERYVVTNLNSGAQTSYASQGEALEALSRIRNLPLIDANLLEAGRRYEISLRATIDIGGLPDAVKLLVFWRDWSRSTDWYTWSIRP